MGDFMPGYVATLANPNIEKVSGNIIVIGFEDGKIYSTFENKNDFFAKVSSRKKRMKMLTYYKNVPFTKEELGRCWDMNVWMMDETQKKHLVKTYIGDMTRLCLF
jgi:hypothetical protein